MAHRDIKPDNVLCTKPSQLELGNGNGGVALMHVKLADFGLSATFDPDGGREHSNSTPTPKPDPSPNPSPNPNPNPDPDPDPDSNPNPN